MNETELYGYSGVRSGDQVSITTNSGRGFKASATDPNLRDRLIEYLEEHAEDLADKLLGELDLNDEEETDYDRWTDSGD